MFNFAPSSFDKKANKKGKKDLPSSASQAEPASSGWGNVFEDPKPATNDHHNWFDANNNAGETKSHVGWGHNHAEEMEKAAEPVPEEGKDHSPRLARCALNRVCLE